MKPDFTLSLSSEAIQLLHRTDGGWTLVGEVKVADPDLAGALSALRARGVALGNGAPFGTKVLIPNEQIRYLALDTTQTTEDDVRAALDGATPYPVSELSYDFVTGGGRTYISAVSRRTLEEAEAFALSHQMAPLCFCAAPVPFTYVGEAYFGPTKASKDILPFGTFIDRDADPVIITGRLDPEPESAPAPSVPSFMSAGAATAAGASAPEAAPAAPTETEAPEEAPAEPVAEAPARPVEEAQPVQDAPAQDAPVQASVDPEPTNQDTPEADTGAEAAEQPAPASFATRRDPTAPPAPPAAPEPPKEPAALEQPSPGFATRRDPTNPPAVPAPAPPPVAQPNPGATFATRREPTFPPKEAAKDGAAPAFSTRREPTFPPKAAVVEAPAAAAPEAQPKPAAPPAAPEADSAPAPAAGLAADPPPDLTVVGAPLPSPAEVPDITQVGQPLPAPTPPADSEKTVIGAPLPAVPAPSASAPQVGAAPSLGAGATSGGPAPSLRAEPKAGTATSERGGFFSRRKSKPAEATPAKANTDAAVFGTRRDKDALPKVGGKPRFLGLILTVLLFVFMAAVAAYAALNDNGFSWLFGNPDGDEIQVATAPSPIAPQEGPVLQGAAPAQPEAGGASVLPTLPGQLPLPALITSNAPLSDAQGADGIPGFDPESPVQLAAAAPEPQVPLGQILSPDEAERIYAATGVWQRAPRLPLTPRTTSLDGLGTALPISAPGRPGQPALSAAGAYDTDVGLVSPPPPPPPGVDFPRDENGFILATPEGTITPDGVLIFAGAPALRPPVRGGLPEPTPPEPLLETDGLLVLAGAPPLRPPVRPSPEVEPVPETGETNLADAGNAAPDTTAIAEEAAPEVAEVEAPEGPTENDAQTEAIAEASPEDADILLSTADLVVRRGQPPLLPPAREAPEAATADADPANRVLSESDGLIVLAGRPSVAPPVRPVPEAALTETSPEAPAPQSAELAAEDADQAPDTATRAATEAVELAGTEPAAVADLPLAPGGLALAAFRPTARPATLDVPAGALLVPNAELAGFRPRVRPAGLAPAPTPDPVEEAPEDASAAPADPAEPSTSSLAAAIAGAVEEAAAEATPQIVDATRQAVSASARPDARPRNFARVVQTARANQQRQEERAAQQQAASTASVARAAPAPSSGPTAQSVAAAATVENAINLRRVSLIGVYGTPADRRALVRLGNGRYVKVSVGDRLDGGRVASIAESHLDYTKRGQTQRLEMPRG